MTVKVTIYDGDNVEWDAYINAFPGASNYHQFNWKRVIEQSFGHRTYYLVAQNRGNEIRGVLPLVHMNSSLFGNFLISLPFVNYGGLLCSDYEAAEAMISESARILKESGSAHAEFRHLRIWGSGLSLKQHKVTMLLDLEKSMETQWKKLDTKVRNQVRKAEKNGLKTVVGYLELLDGFYEVFCRNMRDLGTPVYGKSFFRNILETFPESTKIVSITLGGKTIASGILTWFKDTIEVPWASSVRDYRELCPNNLLYWEALKFAINRGLRTFDFGRSTPDEGTYRFKKRWGARPVPLFWQYLLSDGKAVPELNPKNPKFDLAIRAWKKLPVSLASLIGPHIVRNIP